MPYTWRNPWSSIAPAVQQWGRGAGLLLWASWTVDSLHYLEELDRAVFDGRVEAASRYERDTLDLAHGRWTLASALTALDLCGAALARSKLAVGSDRREVSLGEIGPNDRRAEKRFHQLPDPAKEWVVRTLTDDDYRLLTALRHPMTHSSVGRSIHRVLGSSAGLQPRVSFKMPQSELGSEDQAAVVSTWRVDQLIGQTVSFTTRRVEDLFALIAAGAL